SICRIDATHGESTGGYVLTLQLRVNDREQALAGCIRTQPPFEPLLARGDVLAAHHFVADDSASNVQTAEAKERAFTVPSHILMFEAARLDGIEACRDALDSYDWSSHGATAERCNVYALEISRLSKALNH